MSVPAEYFLSCLCGSELVTDDDVTELQFLSCLCGSERQAG